MVNVQPYLIFNGNCEEALNFYCDVFGGEIQLVTRFKETPVTAPADWDNKIMHAAFTIFGDQLLASDCFPGNEARHGNNINLSVSFDHSNIMDATFKKLSAGGKITMPLQDTYWGARYGQLVDRYGINWMFNQELENKKTVDEQLVWVS